MMSIFWVIIAEFGFLFVYALSRFVRRRKMLSLFYALAWTGYPAMAAREMRLLPRFVADQFLAAALVVGAVCVIAVVIHEMHQ